MANKKTLKEYFGEIREIMEEINREDLVQFCDERIELLNKKSASRTTDTAKSKANAYVKGLILQTLANIEKGTITEIIKANDELAQVTNGSNQRVSALMTQLKADGIVVRTEEKRKAYFSIAEGVDITEFIVEKPADEENED